MRSTSLSCSSVNSVASAKKCGGGGGGRVHIRCCAHREGTELARRDALLAGGSLLSYLALPGTAQAKTVDFILAPEKLSAAQVTTQREQVQRRAEKRLFKTLTADDAPFAMRLVFNDAGTFDYATKSGGFDGSIVIGEELDRPENAMLKPLVAKLSDIKKEVDEENAANGQGAISWADLLVLAARATVTKEWLRQKRKKTASDQDAQFLSNAFGSAWPVKLGRVDSGKPGPADRIPQLDASVSEIKDFLLQLGAKQDGGFAYRPPFTERPGFVVYTAAQPDPEKAEEFLATDPDFAVWKKDYDKSRRTLTRTNYEVDFITYFNRLISLGVKFDRLAYLKPVVIKSKGF